MARPAVSSPPAPVSTSRPRRRADGAAAGQVPVGVVLIAARVALVALIALVALERARGKGRVHLVHPFIAQRVRRFARLLRRLARVLGQRARRFRRRHVRRLCRAGRRGRLRRIRRAGRLLRGGDERRVGRLCAHGLLAQQRVPAAEREARAGDERLARRAAVHLHVRADVARAVAARQQRDGKRARLLAERDAAVGILQRRADAGAEHHAHIAPGKRHGRAVVLQPHLEHVARIPRHDLERVRAHGPHHVERERKGLDLPCRGLLHPSLLSGLPRPGLP